MHAMKQKRGKMALRLERDAALLSMFPAKAL